MRIFSGFYKIIGIEVSPELIDLITLLIDDIEGVIRDRRVKIKCVSGVIGCIEVIHLIRRDLINLADILRIRVIILLVVPHIIHVIVRIGVVIVPLTGILELFDLESLLDENILHVVRQVVNLVLSLIVLILLRLRLPKYLHLQVLYLHLVKQVELRPTDYPL